jgi:hypothetical protein
MSHKIHKHNRTWFVSLDGNDMSGRMGDAERPYQNIQTVIPLVNDGDTIHVRQGVYDFAGINPSFGRDGIRIFYYLEAGVKFIKNDMITNVIAFGFGDEIVETDLSGYDVSILGHGEFSSNSSSGRVLGVGQYNGQFNLESDRITITDGVDGVYSHANRSDIKIRELIQGTGRTGYSSRTSPNGANTYERYIKIDYLEMDQNPVVSRGCRMQPSGGPSDTLDFIEIGHIRCNPGSYMRLTPVYFQTDVGVTRGNYVVRVGSIRDFSNSGNLLQPYSSVSNDAGLIGGMFAFAGPGGALNEACIWDINYGAVYSNRQILSLQGSDFRLGSMAKFHCENGFTTGQPAIGVYDPHISESSRVIISGNYTTSAASPCVLINQLQFGDGTGKLIFKDCRFESQGIGQPVVAINGNSVDHSTIQFENCTFINDMNVAPVVSNAGAPININFINCYANSLVLDVNITETIDTITRNTNII